MVVTAGWPRCPPPDPLLRRQAAYLEDTIAGLRKTIGKAEAPRKGQAQPRVKAVELVVSERYGGWQAMVLEVSTWIEERCFVCVCVSECTPRCVATKLRPLSPFPTPHPPNSSL
jgi:hypothetical protein